MNLRELGKTGASRLAIEALNQTPSKSRASHISSALHVGFLVLQGHHVAFNLGPFQKLSTFERGDSLAALSNQDSS